jgi:PII-like signaling protein
MLKQGPAKKVTVYVGEDVHYHGEPIYLAVLNYLFYHSVSGATVTKGVAGFGAHHHMHTARILEISENPPIKIEFVEEAAKLDTILPKLVDMVSPGLVEIQDTTVVTIAKAADDRRKRPRLPHVALTGKAKLMRIFIGENDRWRGKMLYDAIVESLRTNDIAGVTVYRGIAGYGAHRHVHKERRVSLSHDQPIILSVIDEEAKIRACLPVLEQMIDLNKRLTSRRARHDTHRPGKDGPHPFRRGRSVARQAPVRGDP